MKKGNIILTFIMLIALATFTTSLLFMVSSNLRQLISQVSREKAFYVADAGLSKAKWYIKTPEEQDGMGESWRTTGLTEAFDGGQYTMIIASGPGTSITITVTGEAYGERRTIQVEMASGTPLAFNYSIFSNSDLTLDKDTVGVGNIYVNGNTAVAAGTVISDGSIYHPSDTTISGSGTYTDGGTPSTTPQMPTLDTSQYTDEITTAERMPAAPASYGSPLTLSENIYVNGDISISSDLVISGSGTIVASGNITMANNVTATGDVNFICGGTFDASKNLTIANSSIYAGTSVYLGKDLTATTMSVKSIVTAGTMTIKKNCGYTGLLYAQSSLSMDKNANIIGSVVANSLTLDKTSNYIFSPVSAPANVFIGTFSQTLGSWKEL